MNSSNCFSTNVMKTFLANDVWKRFKDSSTNGTMLSEDDKNVITKVLSSWAILRGAEMFAHWFFPLRGGGGMIGGHGAMKHNTIFKMTGINKIEKQLPLHALWKGETDGSSFPNGGLRETHAAAAYTTWDRTSAPFVVGKTLYIPACFIAWNGSPLDYKTPLLRSQDAVNREGKRFLKAINFGEVEKVHSYLGWEQEFFVVSADLYKRRPDLVACGRTLFGQLPARNQQSDLNYFARVPAKVETFLTELTNEMINIGCPVACYHNEVAPGQYEISPIFTTANQSADYNELMMDMACVLATKHGLVVLFHEKPFAGINGSGKHNNWSVGTNTNVNFFKPGKDKKRQELFMCAVAALMYALDKYNTLIRCSIAGAGNDHRLGAQEAPPAVISLYPGKHMEQKIKDIIKGGKLDGYDGKGMQLKTGTNATEPTIEASREDRNRTAPFPFCGNRWEFRAVGSSQNCCNPITMVNTAFADGMSQLSSLIENGTSKRDAVAKLMREHERIIFTGNGYSNEWLEEAKIRGLPNLKDTYNAVLMFNKPDHKELLSKMLGLKDKDLEARKEIMFDNYSTCLKIEVDVMQRMVDTGYVPACMQDLSIYQNFPNLASERKIIYQKIMDENSKLKKLFAMIPKGNLQDECEYLTNVIKPQMQALRNAVDQAELLCKKNLWPYPSYEELIYTF